MSRTYLETPLSVTLCITQTCNLQCKHCYSDCKNSLSQEELSTDELLAFIDYLIEHNFIQINIEGGEPLYRKDFSQILSRCCRKMFTTVRTNGTMVSPTVAREFKDLGVGRVIVDIMGAQSATHDYFAGEPGSFAKACAAVADFLDVGIPTDLLIILNRRNAPELQDYLELAARLGVPRVGILRLYPLGRAKQRWQELALTLPEQTAALSALKPPPGLKIMQSWHPNDRNCCWQSTAVNPFGRFHRLSLPARVCELRQYPCHAVSGYLA